VLLVIVTVLPDIEHAPLAPSVTASPEEALAETVKVLLYAAEEGAPVNVMVWLILFTAKLCATVGAAL
jgi:hypothetical protein